MVSKQQTEIASKSKWDYIDDKVAKFADKVLID